LNENGDQISPRLFKPGAQRLATKPTPSECAGVARDASNVEEGVQFLYWVLNHL